MTTSVRQKKIPSKIPLKFVLVIPFVTIIILAVSWIGYIGFSNGINSANNAASRTRKEISERIEDHLRVFLKVPHQVNEFNIAAIQNGWVDVKDEKRLQAFFLEQVKSQNTITSIYFGNADGGIIGSGREGPGGSYYVYATEDLKRGAFKKYALTESDEIGELTANILDFDARTRPWYTGAKEKGALRWNDIYIIFTGEGMALSASAPVYDQQENFLGVVSVDIFLSQVEDFLQSLKVSETGETFIMERSGLLVASSSGEKQVANKDGAWTRIDARESQSRLTKYSADFLYEHTGGTYNITKDETMEFTADGSRYFLTVAPVQDKYGIDWLTIVIIPETDFTAEIVRANRSTAVVALIALLISISVSVFVSQKISNRIASMNESIRAFAHGKGEGLDAVSNSRIQEIDELALSFVEMKEQLRGTLADLQGEVSERRTIETALRENERRYKMVSELTSDYIYKISISKEGALSLDFVTDSFRAATGREVNQVRTLESWNGIFHPDDKKIVMEFIQKLLVTHQPGAIECRSYTINGVMRWIEISARPEWDEQENRVTSIIGAVKDITERRLASEKIRASEEQLKAVIEGSQLGFSDWDIKTGNIHRNERWASMLGYTIEEIESNYMQWEELLHPNDRERVKQTLKDHIEKKTPIHRDEYRLRAKDGTYRWILDQGTVVEYDEAGRPARMTATHTDITDRKKAEHALKESEERYRTVSSNAPIVSFVLDEKAVFTFSEGKGLEKLGLKPGQVVGLSAYDVYRDYPRVTEAIKAAVTGKNIRNEVEVQGIVFDVTYTPIFDEQNKVIKIIGVANDITERKQANDAIQKQLKELTVLHAAALAETTARNMDELIQRVTDIIGETLYPDNCGVHILTPSGDKLIPHESYRGVDASLFTDGIPLEQGIVGKVATTGISICLGDVLQDPAYVSVSNGIHSELCVPIISESRVIGVINVESKSPNAFTENDERLLNTIAGGVATSIKKIQLFESEQSRRKKAEVLMNATTALANMLDIDSLYNAIFEWLHKITPYDSASIFEQKKDGIRLTAGKGLPNIENILGAMFSSDNELYQTICETGKPLIVEDCQKDARFKKWAGVNYVRGWMGVPLISRGQVIGQINIDSRTPNAYTESDAIAVQTLAHQAATSIENVRLLTETLQRLSELEIISRVSSSLRAAHSTEEMFPILLDEIQTNMDTDSVAIWLHNHQANLLEPKAASGRFSNLSQFIFKPNEGIIGKVYASEMMSTSDDFNNEPGIAAESENFFGKGYGGITVPIRTTAGTIGVLSVATHFSSNLKYHQIRLITTLAEIAGNAIYRSNLYERSKEQISQLTTLRELDIAIASSLDLRITLNILTENLLSQMKADSAAALVFNPNSQMLEYYALSGFKNQNTLRDSIGMDDELIGKALLTREPQYINDIRRENTPRLRKMIAAENITSYYAVALFSKGAARGVLEIYFRKPFSPTTEWENFIQALAGQATIAIDNAQLFENLQRTNQELSLAYDTTLEGWGKALELRDKETQGHTHRVADLTIKIARQMGIAESELLNVRRGALLHDIGKMGVPDRILRKKGPLTKAEFAEMRKHPQYARDLLYHINYLRPVIDIPYCHHEWWDGSGYPRGLKGEEIPLAARVFSIVDVWDALLSDRPYRRAWNDKKTLKYIKSLSGKQFDPRVVDEFYRMIKGEDIENRESAKNTKTR